MFFWESSDLVQSRGSPEEYFNFNLIGNLKPFLIYYIAREESIDLKSYWVTLGLELISRDSICLIAKLNKSNP